MRVLLDECVPSQLRRELPGHTVMTVAQAGMDGLQNGTLLRRAAQEFDVFLTADSNIEYQQNTSRLPIPIIILVAYSNAPHILGLLMPQVRALLTTLEPGRLYRIGPPKPTR